MPIRRFILPTAAAGAIAVIAAPPAGAHVTVTPDTTAAGAYAVLTFGVPHGCDGSATTRIAIRLPEEIPQVTPTRNPLWDVRVVTEPLAEPLEDSHGNSITERESTVVYTARRPLPDGVNDSLELSVQLPDAAGDTLAFPVVQTCQRGETGWTEIAEEGQDAHELESPAPVITLTEEGQEAEQVAGSSTSGSDDGREESEPAAEDDGNGLSVAALVAGIAGILAGGAALARSGRKA